MRRLGSREWTDPPGGPACYVSLWALRNDRTVLLVEGSGWQHSGSGETQVVPGEGGEPSRGTQSCTWGAPLFSQSLSSAGTQPQPQRQSEGQAPRTARALCSQDPRPQRHPEGPESELTSLPHTPTHPKPRAPPGGRGGSGEARGGHQDRSRETDRQDWAWSQRCFQPLQSRAVWPWARDLTFLSLCVLGCRTGKGPPASALS